MPEQQRDPEDPYIDTSSDGRRWTIGDGLIERTLIFSAMHGLYTDRWEHKLSGTNFLAPLPAFEEWRRELQWRLEFEFYAGDDRLTGSVPAPPADFQLVGWEESELPRSGRLLEIRLKAVKQPLAVSVFYAVYAGHPVIRKWISITNSGDATVLLTRLAFEKLDLQAAPPSEQLVWGGYGVHPREVFYTGRVEDPAIVEMNPRTREGFVVMNEAPGWMKRTQMITFGEGISVMYDTDLFPFKRKLKPGETFASAKSGIAFFLQEQGMADPRWVMPHYTSEVLMKKGTAYRLSGPGPALMLDLEAWQKYFGFDPNSAYASMTVGVDLDALVLTGLFSGEIPQVKTMPLFNRDIKGEVAEGGRRPGPFLQLPKTSTQISIDPRQRKQ